MRGPLLDLEGFKLAPGDAVSCGNRKDLVKAQRRHDWRELGIDDRHDPESGDFRPRRAFMCIRCGRDEDESVNAKARREAKDD